MLRPIFLVPLFIGACDIGSNPKDYENEIYASLSMSNSAHVLKECFGSEIGSWELACDLYNMPEVTGFFVTVSSAIQKLKNFQPHAPELGLQLTVKVEGVADVHKWRIYGPQAQQMETVFWRLANKHGYDQIPSNLNVMLACTRMLVLYDHLAPVINNLMAELTALKNSPRFELICGEVTNSGPQYRGALLEARLKFTVPPEYSSMAQQTMRESGMILIENNGQQ